MICTADHVMGEWRKLHIEELNDPYCSLAESTPGPWCSRMEYVTEKSSDTTGNRSQYRPTSSAVP